MVRALALLLLILAPISALGQTIGSFDTFGVDPLTVSLTPRYPRPGETVSIKPSSTVVNLAGSTVVVTAGGKEVGRGSGNESYTVRAGAAGTRTNVRVSVSGPDGNFAKDLVIRPTDVALVVDSLSTKHPFYEGGSLVAPEGRVRVVALADLRTDAGVRIASSNLIYTWRNGGRILQAESGLGKSTLVATAPVLFRDTTVSVIVSSTDGTVIGEASALIAPADPILLVYRSNPLLGPDFAHALSGSYALADTEESFRAVPFFFPSTPLIAWTLGGSDAGLNPAITVRTTGERSGISSLKANARQQGSYYEANEELNISFSGESGTNFFGL